MKKPTRVLLTGPEPRVLETRAVVLAHFWSISTALGSWSQRELAQAVDGADVVVLCDGLSEERRQHYIQAMRSRWPEKIVVQMDEVDSGPTGGVDAMVAVGSGPGALVATIYGLLVERGMVSKTWKNLETTLMDDAMDWPVH